MAARPFSRCPPAQRRSPIGRSFHADLAQAEARALRRSKPSSVAMPPFSQTEGTADSDGAVLALSNCTDDDRAAIAASYALVEDIEFNDEVQNS